LEAGVPPKASSAPLIFTTVAEPMAPKKPLMFFYEISSPIPSSSMDTHPV
jgi:hypothetical protein